MNPEDVEDAVLDWLESLRARSTTPGSEVVYGDDLALATLAGALVEQDREREGALLQPGELTVERLDASGFDSGGMVELDAEIVFPADEAEEPETMVPGRLLGELRVGLGPVYFTVTAGVLELVDYTRDGLRMSATWCTHPQGEDARGGLAVVPQAVTSEAHRGGRVFLEVTNALERDVILRLGRPDRPRGIFARQPPVDAPDVGIPVPAGKSTHLAGLTRRARLTEIEIFAFDAVDRTPVAPLLVSVELPRGHPGEHGQWCA
ncbi:MAG TPA: hypothetical protein VHZ96_19695 [Frankiaceae bacterium]|nr:hypothetical protein [Frankiaceae bacterium]